MTSKELKGRRYINDRGSPHLVFVFHYHQYQQQQPTTATTTHTSPTVPHLLWPNFSFLIHSTLDNDCNKPFVNLSLHSTYHTTYPPFSLTPTNKPQECLVSWTAHPSSQPPTRPAKTSTTSTSSPRSPRSETTPSGTHVSANSPSSPACTIVPSVSSRTTLWRPIALGTISMHATGRIPRGSCIWVRRQRLEDLWASREWW